ncbi:MAG: hypothetical protein AAFO75_14405, partial [Pseudomonadota bacterium]
MATSATVLKLDQLPDLQRRSDVVSEVAFTVAEWKWIEWFRAVANEAQLRGRIDVERACELIAIHPGEEPQRLASALIVASLTYSKVNAPFYRCGTAEVSRIEAWLVRLLGSMKSGDDTSVEMLIR